MPPVRLPKQFLAFVTTVVNQALKDLNQRDPHLLKPKSINLIELFFSHATFYFFIISLKVFDIDVKDAFCPC